MTKTISPRAAFNAAVKEARKVWPDAIVCHDPTAPTKAEKEAHAVQHDKSHPRYYKWRWQIGRPDQVLGMFNMIKGSGDTWEECWKQARTL